MSHRYVQQDQTIADYFNTINDFLIVSIRSLLIFEVSQTFQPSVAQGSTFVFERAECMTNIKAIRHFGK